MRKLLIARYDTDQYFIDALEDLDQDVVVVSVQAINGPVCLKSTKFPIYQYPNRQVLKQDLIPYYTGLGDFIVKLDIGPFKLIPSFGYEIFNLFMPKYEQWSHTKNEKTEKIAFHHRLMKSNVNLPKLYDIVNEDELPDESKIEKYPCIVKPSVGTGGVGVEVIHNKKQLDLFFNKSVPRNSKDQISPRLCYGQKFINYFNYWSQGKPYIIQELIEGRSVAAGITISRDLNPQIEILFDVIHSPHEIYRGEAGYLFPSSGGARDLELMNELLQDLNDVGELSPGHYMIDAIIKEDQIYMIEGTPRPSLDACRLLQYGAKRHRSYIKKGLLALDGLSTDSVGVSSDGLPSVYYRYLNFDPGKVAEVTFPEKRQHPKSIKGFYSGLKKDSMIRQPRMTMNLAAQGFAVFVDPDRDRVIADSQKFIESIEIKYKIASCLDFTAPRI